MPDTVHPASPPVDSTPVLMSDNRLWLFPLTGPHRKPHEAEGEPLEAAARLLAEHYGDDEIPAFTAPTPHLLRYLEIFSADATPEPETDLS